MYLQRFYEKPQEHAYHLQAKIQLSYFHRLVNLASEAAIADRLRRKVTTVVIMERSFYSNRFVFTALAKERGFISESEYQTLSFYYDIAVKGWPYFPPLDGLIWLQTPLDEVRT